MAAASLLACVGCQPTAYKITPVPVDRTLEEQVLRAESAWTSDKIVLIDVDGVLMNAPESGLLVEGEHPVSLLVEKLAAAAGDARVRGVVLRINSPGGSVTASDIMYDEVQRFRRRTGRPVVAMLMDVAASGGYYVACACDEIIAQPTCVTGSIGVIMLSFNVEGTLQKIGMEAEAIRSGPRKDAGSLFRRMKPDERAMFQALVDEFHGRFVEVVAAGRPTLDAEAVRKLADGSVYSARQAHAHGLIDRIGTLEDGVARAKALCGAGRVKLVTYKRPMRWKPNVYAGSPAGRPQVNILHIDLPTWLRDPTPRFLYLWAPGV